jgi:hypothetical protein
MRTKLLLLLIFFLLAACGSPQRNTHTITYTAVVTDPYNGYASANTFAKMVGDTLKQEYPSRITDCEMDLLLETKATPTTYSWKCEIVSSTPKEADYYVDRRGFLGAGKNPESARSSSTFGLKQSDSVAKASAAFKQSVGALPRTFNKVIVVGPDANGFYWSVNETFLMVAGSPPE